MTKFSAPRNVELWCANDNGDDVAHTGRFDVLCVQEAGTRSWINKLKQRFSRRTVITPANGQYHLAVVYNPRVFQVTGTRMYQAHPSAADMRKDHKWNFENHRFPLGTVPSPPRGIFLVEGNWFGDPKRPGFILNGHRINRGPNQPCRDWLGHLFDVQRAEIISTLVGEGFEAYDYNDQTPTHVSPMTWVANHGTDHIGISRGMRMEGRMKIGGLAGHSGRVHHKSIGITASFKGHK